MNVGTGRHSGILSGLGDAVRGSILTLAINIEGLLVLLAFNIIRLPKPNFTTGYLSS